MHRGPRNSDDKRPRTKLDLAGKSVCGLDRIQVHTIRTLGQYQLSAGHGETRLDRSELHLARRGFDHRDGLGDIDGEDRIDVYRL